MGDNGKKEIFLQQIYHHLTISGLISEKTSFGHPWGDEKGFSPLSYPTPQHITPSNHEKDIRQSQIETFYLTSTLQNCQSHETQGKSEKLSERLGRQLNDILDEIVKQKKTL